jgi:3-phenylpropionate/trans-cinnamate dioxygenase ferredoxin subunit
MARHVVAVAAEIPPGTRKIVTVRGREIGIFNHGGEFFALLNRCPHQGAELCKGRLIGLATAKEPGRIEWSREGELLKCPWHGWEYDIRTGQSWCDPNDTKVKAFEVTVEPGEALARGPFVAETFAVAVEQDYVVVDV